MVYGSGLCDDFANTGELPACFMLNVGFEKGSDIRHLGRVETPFGVVDLFDRSTNYVPAQD